MQRSASIAFALLLGFLIAPAPVGDKAAAQSSTAIETPLNDGILFYALNYFGLGSLFGFEQQNYEINLRSLTTGYDMAFRGLRDNNPVLFRRGRNIVANWAKRDKSEDKEITNLATNLLASLPENFVANLVFVTDNGSVVTEPSEWLRYQLARQGDISAVGGGGGDGAR